MELRHLKYFKVVAELNFRRASEKLYMAEPPLRQQIKDLEEELEVKLFERQPIRLTASGQAFLQEIKAILEQVEKAIIIARTTNRGEIGSLIVGTTSASINSFLPNIIQTFHARFPIAISKNAESLQLNLRYDFD